MDAGRELDALVAEKVMGLEVARATAPAIHVEGEWSVHPADEVPSVGPESGWMCYSGLEPVYVDRCGCDIAKPEPRSADDWLIQSAGSREAAEAKCAEWYKDEVAEYEADLARWGHSHHCLEVVPRYSTDIAAAWEVVKKMPQRFSLEVNGHEFSATWYETRPTTPWDFVVKARAIAETAPLAICLAALQAVGASPLPERTPR